MVNSLSDDFAWEPLDKECSGLSQMVRMYGGRVKRLMLHPGFQSGPSTRLTIVIADHGAMKANIMLAYRHMEDAAGWLEKALRVLKGESI